jgi:hypothetical protein
MARPEKILRTRRDRVDGHVQGHTQEMRTLPTGCDWSAFASATWVWDADTYACRAVATWVDVGPINRVTDVTRCCPS